jgi:protein CpxP
MEEQRNPRRRRAKAWLIAAVVAISAAAAGSIATAASGFGPGSWHHGGFMGGMGGGMGGFGGFMEPEQRVERMIKHLAVEVDATADQQSKLVAIAKGAVKDLLPMREKALATRQQAVDLLSAATVDRAAIERLRSEQLALAETASKRIAQAIGDAAEVLTPAQRKDLADRVGPWARWHRG